MKYVVDEKTLAQIIAAHAPADKTIRLLSCSSLESAHQLSVALQGRVIEASQGAMRLFSDGTVEASQWKRIKGTSEELIDNPVAPKSTTNKSAFVQLGEQTQITNWQELQQVLVKNGLTNKNEEFIQGLYTWLKEEQNIDPSTLKDNTKSQWITTFGNYEKYTKNLLNTPMSVKYAYLFDKNNVEVLELLKSRNMQDVFVKQSYSPAQAVEIIAGELADHIAVKELLNKPKYGGKHSLLSGVEMFDKTGKTMGEMDMLWLNADKTIAYMHEVKGTANSSAGQAMEQLITRQNNLALYQANPTDYTLKIWKNGQWAELPTGSINISQTNISKIILETVGATNHDYIEKIAYTSGWLTAQARKFYTTFH